MEQENNQQSTIDIQNIPKEQLGNYMIVQDYKAEKYLYVKLNSVPGTSWAVSVMGKTLKVKTGRERLLAFYYYTNNQRAFNFILGQVVNGKFRLTLNFINAFREVFEQACPATPISKFSWKMIPGYATEKTPFYTGYGEVSISKEEEEKLLKDIWNHKRAALNTTREWVRGQTYDYINDEQHPNEEDLASGFLKMHGINVEQLEAHDPDEDLLFVPDNDLSEHEMKVQKKRIKKIKEYCEDAWFSTIGVSFLILGGFALSIGAVIAYSDSWVVFFFIMIAIAVGVVALLVPFAIQDVFVDCKERKQKLKQSTRKSILDKFYKNNTNQ